MTIAHLVFAVATTHILNAIELEEHDLIEYYGGAYLRYRRRMPMVLPIRKPKPEERREPVGAAIR